MAPNQVANDLIDELIVRELEVMVKLPQAFLSAAKLKALTQRYGKPTLNDERRGRLEKALQLVGTIDHDEDAETSAA